MNKENKFDLLQVAFLIERNNHLSASSAGLSERKKNRDKAINMLLSMIGITITEFEDKYNRLHDINT